MMACSVKHDDVACYELLAFTSKYPEDAKTPEANAALKKHGDLTAPAHAVAGAPVDRVPGMASGRVVAMPSGEDLHGVAHGVQGARSRANPSTRPLRTLPSTPPDPSRDPYRPIDGPLRTHPAIPTDPSIDPPDPSRDPYQPIADPSGPIPRPLPTPR